MQDHKRRIFKIVLISLGILVVIFCIMLCFNDQQGCCGEHDAAYLSTRGYSKELKLSALEYDDIQKEYGTPESIVREQSAVNPDVMLVCNEYPGVLVQYSEVTEFNGALTKYIYLITITGEEFHFGPLSIGIGSSRAQVRFAYLLDQKIDAEELAYSAEEFPDVDEGYYGDSWSRILFSYDENGKVDSMAMEPSAFWGW